MKILAFAGSLRKGSFNKSLLRAAVEVSPEGMNIEIFDLEGIPLFNAEIELQGDPEKDDEMGNTLPENSIKK